MKRFLLILFIALSLTWLAQIRTDGFSVAAISAPLFSDQILPHSLEVEKALSQPFRYLTKGRQTFVFQSLDGRYVLKFFNQNYLRTPWYAFLFAEKEKIKRQRRCLFYETSYEIAFHELGEQILYLHTAPSDRPLPLTIIIDRASREHPIDLDHLPFVLQKKGTPFYSHLHAIYRSQGVEGLHRQIDLFVDAIEKRIEKKIADADSDVEHNWGYVDGILFHMDPGRLFYDERLTDPARRKEEWHTASHNFHKWLKKNYPDAAPYLVALQDRKFNVSQIAQKAVE